MLVNELVINAFKHAFNSKDSGILEVQLNKKQDQATLIISDNGPGLPDDFDARTDSLGSLLINTVLSQLEAEMDIEDKTGSTFTFHFPLN
ncbi:hypothetical protein CK503_02515 [Aliifodinibius salipaludis]|uniref:Histidine kinase domain-containing protein n=1 Tax=Fodinibius salipaludis TaxID=2032627 RepID=A0A2A2GE95_9BACT|nr:sensor histidine kinase [Aliifodinibius salipaludis]PAU95092.1 hypothetical protein CK503_02515 [Aliifodinibius salipaludis]